MKYIILIMLIVNSIILKAQNQNPWSEYMSPSSTHRLLSEYSGSFKMEITMLMDDGKETPKIIVNSEHVMLFNGLFLEMKQQGNMVGMNYQSIMTLGFNNADKKMTLIAITNMGTGTLYLNGEWDENLKTGNLYGQLTNPVNKKTIKVRQTINFVDSDTILIENYDTEENSPEKKTVIYKLIRNKD